MATLQIREKEKEDFLTTAKRLGRVFLKRFVPVTTWSRTVTRKELLDDAIGGLIVGVMIIPTCLSWASLAGLPLSCGLSGALVASFSYGTFGSCAVLSLCPVAEITTLLISIAGIAPEDREQTYQSLGVQVGLLSIILSFMDGGKVIKTVFAKAVGDGYTCAAALLAVCVQLKVMFNLRVDVSPPPTLLQDVLYHTFLAFKAQATMKSIYCFLLFMTYCSYLIYIKKCGLPLWIPHQLIVVVVSTCLTAFLRLDEKLNLGVVGDIESGLSLPNFPPWRNIIGLGPYTITVTMISFVQMYVIAQRVMPDLDANAELFASGITNFLCNIFSGMPVTNSLGCSSVLLEQHVHTPFTAYVVGMILLVTILFLTKLFYFLPKQALGAIVVASVWRLLDFSGPFSLWRYSRMDAAVWVLTFLLTVFGGITIGVLSGIALSLVLIVLRIARPRAVSVGFNMKTFRYGDLLQDPELLVYPNILMWRFDAPLYFINMSYFEERLIAALKNEVRPIDVVLVTCGKVNDIDAAALSSIPTTLETVSRTIKGRPVRIILTDIHGRLEKVLLESAMLPIYTAEEYDGLSISDLAKAGKKFPVVFKKLEDAIRFAQKVISEKYGNVDTAPYPNVSFLTDVVVDMTRQMDVPLSGANVSFALAAEALAMGAGDEDAVGIYISPTSHTEAATTEQFSKLERLKRISKFSPDRELIGVMGVVRHAELTPKQKLKITFWDPDLLQAVTNINRSVAGSGTGNSASSKRTVEQLKPLFELATKKRAEGTLDDVESWDRVRVIVDSRPRGLKLQLKAITGIDASSFNETLAALRASATFKDGESADSAMLIVKWGGVLTQPGVAQAHVLGEKLFARFFAAGDLPLRGLVDSIHNPTIIASEESRVMDTALVVMNALTRQTTPLTKKDVKVDNPLLKTLSEPAKVLLHEEYRYFEALMHISSPASARHFFHLPGFRELLLIPELDRPLAMTPTNTGDGTHFRDVSFGRNNGLSQELSGTFSMGPDRTLNTAHTRLAALDSDEEMDRLEREESDAVRAANEVVGDMYYTPIQVLEELVEKLDTVSACPLPKELLNLKLSNHETLREMRARYGALLENLRGAKRQRRAELVARRQADRQSHSGAASSQRNYSHADADDDDSDADDVVAPRRKNNEAPKATSSFSSPRTHGSTGTRASEAQSDSEQVSVAGTSSAGEDDDDDNHDPVLRELMIDADHHADNDSDQDPPSAEPSGCFEKSTHTRPPTPPAAGQARARAPSPPRPTSRTTPTLPRSTHLRAKRVPSRSSSASRIHVPTTVQRDDQHSPHRCRSQSAPSSKDHAAHSSPAASPFTPSPQGFHVPEGTPRYDVTDLTKLRDYGSYDSAYNLPLLRSLAATTGLSSLRRFLYAFERFAHITACMATVSENILVGVNSSKRFIIGSLVSGKLLRRLQADFRDIAKKDEEQGVKELLEKARALYMSEHSNLKEDARSVLRKVRDDVCACCDSREDEEERARAASEAEREFRLRFPFVNLPDQVTASPQPQAKGNVAYAPGSGSAPSTADPVNASRTRFYFTSYIHVEGLLQCLYESDIVHGFLRPSKQEEEVSMQNYMKHVLFKVFRRRNVSFTDDQALESFRRLNLIFRSDVPYERQQKELLRSLAQTYHAMYYVSIEVYLSMGDAAVSPKLNDGPDSDAGNTLLLDVALAGSPLDSNHSNISGEAGVGGGLGDLHLRGPYASGTATGTGTAACSSCGQEDARTRDADEGIDGGMSFSRSDSSPRVGSGEDGANDSDDNNSLSDATHSRASTASPSAPEPLVSTPHSAGQNVLNSDRTASGLTLRPSNNHVDEGVDTTRFSAGAAVSAHTLADQAITAEKLRHLSLSFAQMPRLNDCEGAGITSPSLLLTHPSADSMGPMPLSGESAGSGPHSFNSASEGVRGAAQAALAGAVSASVGGGGGSSPLPNTGDPATPKTRLNTTASFLTPAVTTGAGSHSPRHHRRHHRHGSPRGTEAAASSAAPSIAGSMGGEGASTMPFAGVVLTTPEEGRKTAQVQEMLYRASTVTPMRRIHEGLSLSDVRQLVGEAVSAAISQAYPDHK